MPAKTYILAKPLSTHWRKATCREVECPHWLMGWETRIDESTEMGQRRAGYIRRESGRAFTEVREGGLTVFSFPPGQRCFRNHQLPLERNAVPIILQNGQRRTVEGDAWIEDFNNTSYRIGQRRKEV